MPELAEVEYYRKEWDPGIGDPIVEVLAHPKARIFRDAPARAIVKHLKGEKLTGSFAHGKQMLFQFSNGHWLGLHLGMTGRLSSQPRDYEPEKHDHLVLRGKKQTLVFCDPRMFGKVIFDRCEDFPEWWAALPPAVTSDRFTRTKMEAFLGRFKKSPIKTVLMDQRFFPGIGNWMADEICWKIKIDPATRCGDMTAKQVNELWKATREVSRKALQIIGEDWSDPPKTWLFTHRWKDGGKCPRKGCGADLVRADLRGRTTCWCPQCQG